MALAELRSRQLFWLLLALARGCVRGGQPGGGAGLWGLGLAAGGCASLALNALLFFAYQVFFGSVYVGLALVLAFFMLGLCGGPPWPWLRAWSVWRAPAGPCWCPGRCSREPACSV